MSILFGPTRRVDKKIEEPPQITPEKKGGGFFSNIFKEPDFIKNAPTPKPPTPFKETTIGETLSTVWKNFRSKSVGESYIDPILADRIAQLEPKKYDEVRKSLAEAGVVYPSGMQGWQQPIYQGGITPLDELAEDALIKKYALEKAIMDDNRETMAREGRWDKKPDSFYKEQLPQKIEDITKQVIEQNKETIETRKKYIEEEVTKEFLKKYELGEDEFTEEQKTKLNDWVAQNIDIDYLTSEEITTSLIPALTQSFRRLKPMPVDIFLEAAKEEFTSGLLEANVDPITPGEEVIATLGHVTGLVAGLALTGGLLKGGLLLTRGGRYSEKIYSVSKTGRRGMPIGQRVVGAKEVFPKVHAFSRTNPLIFNRAIQAGAFNIHGQLRPELRGNLEARLQSLFFDTSLAILFPFITEIFPPIKGSFKIIGTSSSGLLFGGLSLLNGDPKEIVITNTLAGTVIHGMGLMNHNQATNYLKHHAKRNLETFSGQKIPKGYTDKYIDDIKKIALSKEDGRAREILQPTKTDTEGWFSNVESIKKSAKHLTDIKKTPAEERTFQDNPITNFKKTLNDLRKELKNILGTITKPKFTPAAIDEIIIETQPGNPKLMHDIVPGEKNTLVISDFKTTLEANTVKLIRNGDARKNYDKRVQELETDLKKARMFPKDQKVEKFKALADRLELLKGIGRQLGFEGRRTTDIVTKRDKTYIAKVFQRNDVSKLLDVLATQINSLGGESPGIKRAGFERIRKSVTDIADTYKESLGVSEKDFMREILRRSDSLFSGRDVSTQYIDNARIEDWLKIKKAKEGLTNLPKINSNVKPSQLEIKFKEIPEENKPLAKEARVFRTAREFMNEFGDNFATDKQGVDFYHNALRERLTEIDNLEILGLRLAARDTQSTHLINTPERNAMRAEWVIKSYGKGAKIKERRIDIITGPPGSAKSTIFANNLKKQHGSKLIDADEVKPLIPEFNKGKGSAIVASESGAIVEGPVLKMAIRNGDNIVLPKVGKTIDGSSGLNAINYMLFEQGYQIHLHHVTLPPKVAAQRAWDRYKSKNEDDPGRRFTDPDYVINEVGFKPDAGYDRIKNNGVILTYEKYSNNVATGTPPIRLDWGNNIRGREVTHARRAIGPKSRKDIKRIIERVKVEREEGATKEFRKGFKKELEVILSRSDFEGKIKSKFGKDNTLIQEDTKTGIITESRKFSIPEMQAISKLINIGLPTQIVPIPKEFLSDWKPAKVAKVGEEILVSPERTEIKEIAFQKLRELTQKKDHQGVASVGNSILQALNKKFFPKSKITIEDNFAGYFKNREGSNTLIDGPEKEFIGIIYAKLNNQDSVLKRNLAGKEHPNLILDFETKLTQKQQEKLIQDILEIAPDLGGDTFRLERNSALVSYVPEYMGKISPKETLKIFDNVVIKLKEKDWKFKHRQERSLNELIENKNYGKRIKELRNANKGIERAFQKGRNSDFRGTLERTLAKEFGFDRTRELAETFGIKEKIKPPTKAVKVVPEAVVEKLPAIPKELKLLAKEARKYKLGTPEQNVKLFIAEILSRRGNSVMKSGYNLLGLEPTMNKGVVAKRITDFFNQAKGIERPPVEVVPEIVAEKPPTKVPVAKVKAPVPEIPKIAKGFKEELAQIVKRDKGRSHFTDDNRLIQEDIKAKLKTTSRQHTIEEMQAISDKLGIKLPSKTLNLTEQKISKKPVNKTQEKVREETSKFLQIDTRPEEGFQIVPDIESPNKVGIIFRNYEFEAIRARNGNILNPRPDRIVSPNVPKDIRQALLRYLDTVYNPNFAEPITGSEVLGFIPKAKGEKQDKPVFQKKGQFDVPSEKNIIRREEILKWLSEQWNVPIRRGKFRKPNAVAVFKAQQEVIRINGRKAFEEVGELGSLYAGTHEVGHFLQKKMPEFAPKKIAEFINELQPIATDGVPLKEGFAEFIRMYTTEPKLLNSKTPNFLTYFEEIMNIRYPQEKSILLEGRKLIDAYSKQDSYTKVLSQIGYEEESMNFGDKIRHIRKNLYNDWVNDLNPISQVVRQAKKEGVLIKGAENPEMLGNLVKNTTSMAHAFISKGTFGKDFFTPTTKIIGFGPFKKTVVDVAKINFKGKGLEKILEPIVTKYGENVGRHELNAYLVSHGTVELAARKKPIVTGIEVKDAQQTIKELDRKFPEFKKTADELQTYQTHVLEFALEHRLISQKEFLAFRTMNKRYIPMFRVMSEGINRGDYGKMLEGASSFKTKVGSDRPIVNPLESIVKNTYSIIHASKKNEMVISMANLALRYPKFGQMFEEIPIPMAKIAKITPKDIFSKTELKIIPKEMQQKIIDIFRPTFAAKENIVVGRFGDKTKLFQTDPDIYRALVASERTPGNIPFITAVLNLPTRTLRAGAILHPDFGVRNFFRDTLMSFTFSKYGFVPFYHTARGMMRVLRADKWLQMYEMSGAAHGNWVSIDRNYLKKDIRKVMQKKATKIGVKIPKNPIDLLRSLSELTENAARVEEFRMSIEHGASTVEAANAAKDLTINYTRSGQYGRAMNMISAFFNARVQGIDKMVREFRDHPARMNIKAFTAITLPSLLLYAVNRDDPDYWKLPEWRRDLFWNFKLNILPGEFLEDNWLSVPKPFELGLIYGTTFEKLWEFLDKKDKSILTGYFLSINNSSLLAGLTPLGEISGMPIPEITAVSPLIENATNIDFFFERPIVPLSMQGVEPEEQYNFYTSETAKGIGKVLNISPLKVQNLMNDYFAGLGRMAVSTVEGALEKAGIVKAPKPPKQDILNNLPGIGALIIATPEGSQSQPVANFFAKLKELDGLEKTYKKKIERNKLVEAEKFLIENPEMSALKHFRSLTREFASFRKTQNTILNSDLSPEEKRQLMDEINRAMTVAAAEAMTYMSPPKR